MSEDPFDHPYDTQYDEDGKQLSTWRLPLNYLFAQAEDGVLVALGVCVGDLDDEALDKLTEEKLENYERRKRGRDVGHGGV
jgi:hypothetical protein